MPCRRCTPQAARPVREVDSCTTLVGAAVRGRMAAMADDDPGATATPAFLTGRHIASQRQRSHTQRAMATADFVLSCWRPSSKMRHCAVVIRSDGARSSQHMLHCLCSRRVFAIRNLRRGSRQDAPLVRFARHVQRRDRVKTVGCRWRLENCRALARRST